MTYLTLLCLLVFQQAVAAADDADRIKASATEQSVLETYKKMEEADRKGDTEAWFGFRDKKSLEAMNPAVKAAILKGGRARPAVRYEPLIVRTGAGAAVLIGKITDPAAGTTHHSVLFVTEGGAWKVSRELFSESAFDPFVLHGLLPPETGGFIRAGSPWKKVAYAAFNTAVLGKKEVTWKMQATYDESFVYIRFEWTSDIPAPGSRITPESAAAGKTGGPPPPPNMQIKVSGAEPEGRSLTVAATDVVSTSGANKFTVSYSMTIKNAAGEDIFQYSLGNDSGGRLLSVQGRYIDLRVPLAGLEVAEAAKPKILLEEQGSVLRILPYTVEHFGDR